MIWKSAQQLGSRDSSAVVEDARSLRQRAAVLGEFEGVRSIWRLPAVVGLRIVLRSLPSLGLATGAGIGAQLSGGGYAPAAAGAVVGTLLGSGLEEAAKVLAARYPPEGIIDNRLSSLESMNPVTAVDVLLPRGERDRAFRALRRAGFVPGSGRLVAEIDGFPRELNSQVYIYESQRRPSGVSDAERLRRVLDILDGAGVRARAGGDDVHGSGR